MVIECAQRYPWSSSGTHPWQEGPVLVLGVCWGIPPLRADAHGTKLVHQLRRYGRDCDTLVLWGGGGGTWWAGSMSEWWAGVRLMSDVWVRGAKLMSELWAGGAGFMSELWVGGAKLLSELWAGGAGFMSELWAGGVGLMTGVSVVSMLAWSGVVLCSVSHYIHWKIASRIYFFYYKLYYAHIVYDAHVQY